MDFKTNLLTALLNCGYLDLVILKDCEYDFSDLIEIVKDYDGEININSLCSAMFELGKGDMQEAINNRIEELEEIELDELQEEEQEELKALKELNPFEDIESFHNSLDTSIYFPYDSDKADIYKKYMQDALDNFENMTGFNIG